MARKRRWNLQVLGVLGGIASGKTFVTGELARLGAAAIDADRIGHAVLREPEVREAVRRRWGDAVFSDGEVDRAKLAAIVFGAGEQAREELAELEKLTHPRITERICDEIDQLDKAGEAPAVVLDAPVLLKAGWSEFCDRMIYVDAPREVRLARAVERGWSEDEFERREAAQESLQAKRRIADFVIDNSRSAESTRQAVAQFWRSLDLPQKRAN